MRDLPAIPQASPLAGYLAQKAEIDAAVARVLSGGRYILGSEVETFESEFAAWLGIPHVVGVANGTDAIELALRALSIGPGDAVIAPTHTAVPTVAAIERSGAKPILIDCDPKHHVVSPSLIERAVMESRRQGVAVKAVIPVHLYGQPADMPAVMEVAQRNGLRVIEDCAQAHGAMIGAQRAGTFGDLAAFSFYPTKNLGALGDGGAAAASDPDLARRLRMLRQYGFSEPNRSEFPGVNSRLDELQAAVLRVKLGRLDADNARRRQIALRYTQAFEPPGVVCPCEAPGTTHVFHLYVIRTRERDALRSFLAERNIGSGIHYPQPVHLQPGYLGRGLTIGDVSNSERLCGEIVSLPLFPQLADTDVDRVIEAVTEWIRAWPQPGAASA